MQGLSLYGLGVAGAAALTLIACEAPDDGNGADPQTTSAAEALDDAAGELAPVNRSGVTGTVEADREDGEVEVTVRLEGLEAGVAYPVSLYQGRCAGGGAVAAPLGRVTARDDGTGTLASRIGAAAIGAADEAFVQVETGGGDALACGDLAGEGGATPMTDRLQPDTGTDAEGGR